MPATLQINIPGFHYADLHVPHRLASLTKIFYESVREKKPELFTRFEVYRSNPEAGLSEPDVSALLIEMGGELSSFIAEMFGIQDHCNAMRVRAEKEQIIFRFKKEFFVRRVIKKYSPEVAAAFDLTVLGRKVEDLRKHFRGLPDDDTELATAALVVELLGHERFLKASLPADSLQYLNDLLERVRKTGLPGEALPSGNDEPALKEFLASMMKIVEQWTAGCYVQKSAQTAAWATFKLPHPVDYEHLVELEPTDIPAPGANVGPAELYRRRDGFDLTDLRYDSRTVMSEVDYCIFCHERSKDSCSRGLKENGAYKNNPLGFKLKGCPLDQKISESQYLKGRGDSLGGLAIIMIDNPMVPGTGHRICNDCMKACIYQKQDPVNIPQIETRILMDVLELPWGFEIYSLLTRWNPLNIRHPHALPYNGMNILIVGLGPAGYTLAHYFLNEGFGVIGIDGLKIEPLPPELVGDGATSFDPVREYAALYRKLGERPLTGFGGVSEYGITVRWDKNFLTVLYLNLMRRERFRIYDGIRFGGTITVDDAWAYGFDHVCIATGAGKPTFVTMKNNLIRGIRKASDFLMALQLTGAGKRESMANLQVQLPALVIGGGLTAIDTATELMAYYPVQVTKISHRYERLVCKYGRENIEQSFDREELERLHVFLDHAAKIKEERKRAAAAGEEPDFIPLLRAWGGVHIYYRKSMIESPAYRLNHEEIIKSLEEGISFVERMNPVEAIPDEQGAVTEMVFDQMEPVDGKWRSSGRLTRVPARTVMVAAGTVPNVMYEREHPGTFELDKWNEFFQPHMAAVDDGKTLLPAGKGDVGFFTSYEHEGRFVSFYGDNHPDFAGNVVKAMASAKHGFKAVLPLLHRNGNRSGHVDWAPLVERLDADLRAHVVEVNRLTPTITEIVVNAPKAAREFQPGQFYRLQNYEADSPRLEETLIMMEGIALTGAWVDKAKGLIGLITLEVGASSRMCAFLQPGQRVVVMGPTGSPTEVTEGGTVLLLGGGLGNAVLFSIAKAFKEKNNTVVYFAGYKRRVDLFKQDEIEAHTDVVVYSVDAGEPIGVRRPQDRSFVGNIVQALLAYSTGALGTVPTPLSAATRIIAIGSDRMMAAVAQARHGVLKPFLNEEHVGVASINSPMQCMMKAVCAQCLQRHINPVTGAEEFVFTCVNQDQLMDEVDFSNLNSRLKANSVMEKLTNRWLDYILEMHPLVRV